MRLREKDWGWWKRDGKRRGGELMGNQRKNKTGGERKGAKARSCNDRPLDYIVAQINRPSAGSLEPSCGAGEESFHFKGLRSSHASDRMGPDHLPTPSPSASQWTEQQGNISLKEPIAYVPFPALTDCLETPSGCRLITVNLWELQRGAL